MVAEPAEATGAFPILQLINKLFFTNMIIKTNL